MPRIVQAGLQELPVLAPLFDAYRVFYKQPSDLEQAHSFLKDRIEKQEATIFLAYVEEEAVGFTQLYQTFSSVAMQPFLILNDLFVTKHYRKQGIGEALLAAAKEYCSQLGYKGLALETAIDNPAQKLYERMGWTQDQEFLHYFWSNAGLQE